ncbi:pyrroline-5-carboxylate reductase [Sutcliffiella cohnii]|uniref:pyrroline-5-carboxylate reductase n=1 Tax=Sutcliffiella cohnii TaxID=33932 RepID=UPI002E22C5B5|nr:pyrroline-5-carboxylate reductase [Sutcliffiella cohnii]MED4017567.1 pyrroline-5-carboxylate reductase [Sutcliffiella cohnii]
MNKTLAFIGCGKMAQAIIGGMIQSGIVDRKRIIASARTEETRQLVKKTFNIKIEGDNKQVAKNADILFLAVKPDVHKEVIDEIKDYVKKDVIVITIAAGITLSYLESGFHNEVRAIRVMPNTPSLVREGMSVIAPNRYVTTDELDLVVKLCETFGQAEVMNEGLMDAIPAISGSSPAYVYMFIEALADGAVKQGIPRDQAYKLGAQAVLGAAKMVLETGKHPGELKDQVCTPGGATIEAVLTLEKEGLHSAVLSAMDVCTEKAKALANN